MLALILLGAISYKRLGISENPDIDFPVINLAFTLEGASPEIMESDIVDYVEEALIPIEGLIEIRSSSRRGLANVTLELELSRDVDVAVQEIQSRLSAVMNKLPPEMDPPVITKRNPEDYPIMWLAVTTDKSLKDLSMFIKDYLRDRIQIVPGVGDMIYGGYLERNIRIWLDPLKLKQYEITPDDVLNTLSEQNIEIPAGRLENKKKEISVRSLGNVPTVEEIQKIYINTRRGVPVYRNIRLSSVGEIEDGLEDVRRISRFNGKTAMSLGVRKIRGANTVEVARAVKKKLEDLKKELPPGFHIDIASDNSTYVEEAIGELQFTIFLAVLFTAFVCRIFLGNFSSTVNILFSIPTSLIGGLFFIYLAGFTLNTFTFLALTLATGIVVDDSIMVLENITRHKESGKDKVSASLDGAKQVSLAALASTLSIAAIFMPVAFMPGVIGKYFLEFGLTVSVTVLLSLFEALTFTPMRSSQFLKTADESNAFDRTMSRFLNYSENRYRRALYFTLKYPVLTLILTFSVFFLSFYYYPHVKKEFSPSRDISKLFIRARLPVGTSIEKTDEEMKKIEAYLAKNQAVDKVFMAVGGFNGGEVNTAMFFVSLKDKDKRPINPNTRKNWTQGELIALFRKELNSLNPSMKAFIQDLSLRGFSSGRGFPVELSLSGPDWEKLAEYSEILKKEFIKQQVLLDVDTDYEEGQPEIKIIPDRKKAAEFGVSMANIGTTLNALIGSRKAGKFTENGKNYDIRVGMKTGTKGLSGKDIELVSLRNNYGEIVNLKELVTLKKEDAIQVITRLNRSRSITFFANPGKGKSQEESIEQALELARKILPKAYILERTGNAKGTEDAFKSLIYAMVLGTLISYMILASQFNSFKYPFIILLSMPFSFTGAIAALYHSGYSLNVYSFIGFILLLGIVKKNSILLVEFSRQKEEEGKSTLRSLLCACPQRLRPILMTSLSSLAAAIPAALALGPGAETRIPMAISIIGGILFSTLLTLFIVPITYKLMSKK